MRRTLFLLILLSSQTYACLWDRDTLAEEAKGRPDLVRIIVGWFDRYPPTYYQKRLDRVIRELQSTPADPGLCDDAAVACDRLGRTGEAIEWMAKKKAILDTLPAAEAKDHRYRYLSNLGTFHLHRWISLPQPQRESDLTDLRESERLIAQAINDNPNAHFGREVYQLMAIRWLLWDGVNPIPTPDDTPYTFDQTHWVATGIRESGSSHIAGISGLIQLGIAWESTDAFRSLAAVLDSDQLSSFAELAYLRENELIAAGKGSLHPVAQVRELIYPNHTNLLLDRKPVGDYFPIARVAADRRNAAWTGYQKQRFAKGMHPDTHPDFWKDWSDPAFPQPPGPTLVQYLNRFPKEHLGIALAILLVFSIVFVRIGFMVARRVLAAWSRKENPSRG